jgi:hypothetical protein
MSRALQGRLLRDASIVELTQMSVQLCSAYQREKEPEESPLLRFVTRKRLVNSHCGELLPSKA